MQSRNYFAILLLVFGIIQVYSYPQSFDTQEFSPSVGSLEDLNDESLRINEKGGRQKRTPGAPKNVNDKLKKIKAEIKRLGLEPGVRTPPAPLDPREEAHLAEVRQYEALVEGLMARFRISRDAAIDRTLRENQAFVNRVFGFDEF